MPSPFPGVDPYLENPELWSEIHSRLIVAIADDLTDHLSERYRVAIEKQPITVIVPMAEEVKERYLEIREVATGSVITAIEVLSPKNKRRGEGRQAYERKRNRVLASLTHLVEIDLLRGGQPLPVLGATKSDYRILISRSDLRPSAQLYAFSLRQTIPKFLVPLASGDSEPVSDLQRILGRVYERGRYHLVIDYTQPAQTPLNEQDAIWARALLP